MSSKEDLAIEFENKGLWRDAFHVWCDLLTDYSIYATEERIAYWERHKEMCSSNF